MGKTYGKKCLRCGRNNEDIAVICINCGERLETIYGQNKQPSSTNTTLKEKHDYVPPERLGSKLLLKKIKIAIILIIIIIVISSLIIYFHLNSKLNADEEKSIGTWKYQNFKFGWEWTFKNDFFSKTIVTTDLFEPGKTYEGTWYCENGVMHIEFPDDEYGGSYIFCWEDFIFEEGEITFIDCGEDQYTPRSTLIKQ